MRTYGFTLLEILIIAAIALFLAIGSFSVYGNYNKSRSLEVSAQNIASLLKTARSKTLASNDASVFGVHFETSRAVLFKGATFSEPNVDNREYRLPGVVTISTINLNGGGNDIIFERLTGETQQFGTTTVSLTDSSKERNITISATGIIEF